MEWRPFDAHYGTNQVLTAAAASAATPIDAKDLCVRISNSGTNKGYIRLYRSDTTPAPSASVADLVILPGDSVIVSKGDGVDRLAYISAVGTTLEVITGQGI